MLTSCVWCMWWAVNKAIDPLTSLSHCSYHTQLQMSLFSGKPSVFLARIHQIRFQLECTCSLILSPITFFTLAPFLPLLWDSPASCTPAERGRGEREREYKSDIYYTSVPIQRGHSSVGLPVTGHHEAPRQLSLLPLLLLFIGATTTK